MALLRAIGSTVGLVVIYYLLPLNHSSTVVAAGMLIIGLVALIILIGFQIRGIVQSPFPGVRAVETLATSLPLFLLIFASTYLVMSAVSANSFNQPLTHTDALYFTVTTFATVGFGDIVAKSEGTRILVTMQMVIDLVILGLGARIVLGAITRGRQRRPDSEGSGQPSASA
jgi:hypothetical protein